MTRSRLTSVLVMAAVLLLPTLVAAQEDPMPLSWVGLVKVKPGAGPQFEKAFEKDGKIKELNSLASWQYYENWGWDRK